MNETFFVDVAPGETLHEALGRLVAASAGLSEDVLVRLRQNVVAMIQGHPGVSHGVNGLEHSVRVYLP